MASEQMLAQLRGHCTQGQAQLLALHEAQHMLRIPHVHCCTHFHLKGIFAKAAFSLKCVTASLTRQYDDADAPVVCDGLHKALPPHQAQVNDDQMRSLHTSSSNYRADQACDPMKEQTIAIHMPVAQLHGRQSNHSLSSYTVHKSDVLVRIGQAANEKIHLSHVTSSLLMQKSCCCG